MGVHYADNAWWLDVLEWGPKSPLRGIFDIDWELLPDRPGGGVLLPILGTPYGEALEQRRDRAAIRCRARAASRPGISSTGLPIDPQRYGDILRKIVAAAGADRRAGRPQAARAGRALPRPAQSVRAAGAGIQGAARRDRGRRGGHRARARGLSRRSRTGRRALALHRLLERQHYRLGALAARGSEINYRRFFDINELAGLRVEDAGTFRGDASRWSRG